MLGCIQWAGHPQAAAVFAAETSRLWCGVPACKPQCLAVRSALLVTHTHASCLAMLHSCRHSRGHCWLAVVSGAVRRHASRLCCCLQVNQILLNFQWSNITFDSLALENFAPGDARSAELARPLSVSSANNFWPLFYNRSEDRLLIQNSTLVLGGQVCGSLGFGV